MDDEESRRQVLPGVSELRLGQKRSAAQLSLIVARLDEQDAAIDHVAEKVDRLRVVVNGAVEGTSQSLTSLISLSRRFVRLERPDADDASGDVQAAKAASMIRAPERDPRHLD